MSQDGKIPFVDLVTPMGNAALEEPPVHSRQNHLIEWLGEAAEGTCRTVVWNISHIGAL